MSCKIFRVLSQPIVLIAMFVSAGVIPAVLNVRAAEPAKGEEGFTSLFDGKSLAGWEGDKKIFRVEEGAIIGGSLKEKIDHNYFLRSTKEYGDFELRLKARLVGDGGNAGVQFRTAKIPNHHEVSGYQCDMGIMDGKNIWGALYDESRRNKFLVVGPDEELKKSMRKDGWNDFVVRCEGPHIQIWVNGIQTVDYTEKEESIARTGILAVQIHGGPPSEASYKEIRIKELK
jgi:hypothetical protein